MEGIGGMNIKEQMKGIDLNDPDFINIKLLCGYVSCAGAIRCSDCIGDAPIVELEAIQKPLTMENLEDSLIKWKILFK